MHKIKALKTQRETKINVKDHVQLHRNSLKIRSGKTKKKSFEARVECVDFNCNYSSCVLLTKII